MMKATVLMLAAGLVTASNVSGACRPSGTQLDCDLGSRRVVIGTQSAAPTTRARPWPTLSFSDDAGFADDPVPRGLQIHLQDFAIEPQLCRRIGNETYCY